MGVRAGGAARPPGRDAHRRRSRPRLRHHADARRGDAPARARPGGAWPATPARSGTTTDGRQTALLELAREVGLGLVSDPHTGSVALPVERALERGVAVALGQDDIEDAYYPFGRHNLLEVAFLAAHLLDMRSAPQLEVLVDLMTTSAARVLGLSGYGLRAGGPADLLVHDADAHRRPARPPRPAAGGDPGRARARRVRTGSEGRGRGDLRPCGASRCTPTLAP